MTSSTGLPGLNEGFIAGTGIRAFSGGGGTAVVLLHGLAGGAANWVEVAPALAARHRVLALDLPGHGGSAPLREASGINAFADAVAAAIEAADAAPALVVGHSFGGQVALRLAERSPALVRGLLLVAPSGIETRRRAARVVVMASALVRPGARIAPFAPLLANRAWFRRAALRPWYVSDAASLSGRATRGLFAELRAHTGLRAAARAMLDDDPRTALHHVGAPTLILWGARDAQLPLEDAFDYARRLDAPIRVVADCGHLLVVERPAAVLDAVDALVRAGAGPTGQTGFSTST